MKKKGFTLLELLIAIAIIAILAAILIPSYSKMRAETKLTSCKSTIKNIAGALELYSNDYAGRYPFLLSSLVSGAYIRKAPRCASTGADTYSASYSPATLPDRYSLYCAGNNHAAGYGLPLSKTANFPQYYGASGFVDPK